MESVTGILVATDFSKSSEKALEVASNIAKLMGARLIIAHVHALPTADQGEGMLHAGVETEQLDAIINRLHAIRPGIDGVRVEHRFLKGDPASEILRLAEIESIAFIVMGTHGRTGLSRLLMGSVAEEIVRRAKCPAMVVNENCL